MRRVAIYCRVSTLEQRPEIQRDALRSYAQSRGLEIVGEYVDHGVSGARDRRPALDSMMADARRRRFDAVACVKLDRLIEHHQVDPEGLEFAGERRQVTDGTGQTIQLDAGDGIEAPPPCIGQH